MNTERFRVISNSSDQQLKVRISDLMSKKLRSEAFHNGRSLNSEILVRLARTLYEDKVDININNKEISL